jgi:hypothetical protein
MMSHEEQMKMLNDTMKFAVPFILLCVCIVFGGVYLSTEMEKKKKAIETGIYEDAIPLGDTLVRVEGNAVLIKNGESWVTAFSEFDKPIEMTSYARLQTILIPKYSCIKKRVDITWLWTKGEISGITTLKVVT